MPSFPVHFAQSQDDNSSIMTNMAESMLKRLKRQLGHNPELEKIY